MNKDKALKMALEAFQAIPEDIEGYLPEICTDAVIAIKEALAQPEQAPTAERAWFTISELNAWADKKLSENPDWVMPRDEPEREWVGLTDEEQQQAYEQWQNDGWGVFYKAIEAKLKEKNT